MKNISFKTSFHAWLVCLTASLFFFYEFMQLNMFNALNLDLMREFQVSAARLGNLSAYYFYANIILLLPAGVIIDRISTRKVILIGMIIAVVSTFGFALSPTLIVAEMFRFLMGITGSFCFLSCIRLASRWFVPQRMALVIGLVVTMAFIGGTIAQTPLILLTDSVGWRNALLIMAGVGVFFVILIFLIVRDQPKTPLSKNRIHISLPFWQGLRMVILNAQNWLAGIYASLLNLPIFLFGAIWGSLYLVQIHNFSRTQASYATSMIFVGTMLGSPAAGWLSDRIARRKLPMILFAIFSLITLLAIVYYPHLSVESAMILFFLIGFFTSSQIISYPLATESNPHALTGTAGGLTSTLIMAGGVTQPLFGWLMDLQWDHTVINGVPIFSLKNYRTALAMITIAFIIALITAFFIKETYCQGADYEN